VCLFSLDKAGAIPVDTHVWQLACRYYAPHLRSKTLNKQACGALSLLLLRSENAVTAGGTPLKCTVTATCCQ
jgi:hypothetical protein